MRTNDPKMRETRAALEAVMYSPLPHGVTAVGRVGMIVDQFGYHELPWFIDAWLAVAFGAPGVSRPTEPNRALALDFHIPGTGESTWIDNLPEALRWAGRYAAAWVAGEEVDMQALADLPLTNDELAQRAIHILRGAATQCKR